MTGLFLPLAPYVGYHALSTDSFCGSKPMCTVFAVGLHIEEYAYLGPHNDLELNA